MARSSRPSRSSPTVIFLFVVAVLVLAAFDQSLLVSRVQHISLASFATQKKKGKDKFRKSPPSPGFLSPHTEARLREAFPDFNKYIHTQTLTPAQFGLGASPPSLALPEPCPDECGVLAGTPDERVIIVGDTHGMNHSLQ